MDEEFPIIPPKKKRRRGRNRKRRKLKVPYHTWARRHHARTQGFRTIIKSGDRVLFTRALKISRVVVIDGLHGNKVVARGPHAYLEVQPNRNVGEFKIAGVGTEMKDGYRLYFRCKYKAWKVKVWLIRPPIYVWPWLVVDE